jgi:hypothetical protein
MILKNILDDRREENYCPTRGMGEKPTPLDEDFRLFVDAAARIQGVKGSSKGWEGLFTCPLEPLDPWTPSLQL